MQLVTTVTQKGQVVIPKTIRDELNIKPFSKLRFNLLDSKIIAQPVLSVDEMHGFIPAREKLSKKKLKQIVKKNVLQKHDNS